MDVTDIEGLAGALGVTRFTQDVPVPDIEEQLRAQGRRVVLLDGTDIEDKAGFLAACEQAFELPDWFGRNWDALEESLADLELGDGLVVLWSGWELFAEAEPDEYATALDVFADAARRFAADDASFVVLLVGESEEDEGEDDYGLDDDPDEGQDLEADEAFLGLGEAGPVDEGPP